MVVYCIILPTNLSFVLGFCVFVTGAVTKRPFRKWNNDLFLSSLTSGTKSSFWTLQSSQYQKNHFVKLCSTMKKTQGHLRKTHVRFILPHRGEPYWGRRRHWAAPFIINQLIKRGSLPLSRSRWWMEREELRKAGHVPWGRGRKWERDQLGKWELGHVSDVKATVSKQTIKILAL